MRHRGRPRVLVVDDDAALRSLVIAVLEDVGCSTASAENGAVALTVLARCQFDVAVVDVTMPVMGGIEFHRELHRLGRTLPMILLSAELRLMPIARDLGVAAAIAKPFDPDHLARVVLEVYVASRGPDSADSAQGEPG